jgi:hypothetical protein
MIPKSTVNRGRWARKQGWTREIGFYSTKDLTDVFCPIDLPKIIYKFFIKTIVLDGVFG